MLMRAEQNKSLRRFNDMSKLISDLENPTPLVRLNKMAPADSQLDLYLKLEWYNPFGSVKDRTAKYLLQGLLERGRLAEGKKIVEPSSGNTGIALAAIANILGLEACITVPEGVPEEKQLILRLLGADLMPTPDDLCPVDHPKDGAIALAHSIVNSPVNAGMYEMPNQYENPDNVKAHYETTGPEIWWQTEGRIDYFFAGLGTCGTISGSGRFLKEWNRDIRIIGIEPQKNHRLPGLKNMKESKEPVIFDRSVVDEIVTVVDEDAYRTTFDLIRRESILAGPSTGAALFAALRYLEGKKGCAVVISPDSAFRYMSFFKEFSGKM